MILRLLGLAALLGLLAAAWLAARVLPTLELRPVVLEPEGLLERLAATRKRGLTEREVETFERDGVVVVRDVLPDRALLRKLEPLLRQHQQINGLSYPQSWLYNGVVRSFLRAGHVVDPLLQLLRRPGVMMEAPIWGAHGFEEFAKTGWHIDSAMGWTGKVTQLSAWLAITEAPHAIEFLRGSSRPGVPADLFRACNRSLELGGVGERLLNWRCALAYSRAKLEPTLGYSSHAWFDLRAGDMILFHGELAHRGVVWHRARLALTTRLIEHHDAGDHFVNEAYCNTNKLAFFPPGHAERRRGRDPLTCIRESLLPRSQRAWRSLNLDRLPPESELGARSRLLRAMVAGVQGLFLSV